MRKNILGSVIKDIRKSKQMTQKELSSLTKFSQNTISNHENGNRSLDEDDIIKYASALNVTPEFLFEQIELSENRDGTEYDIHERFGELAKNRISELDMEKNSIAIKLDVSIARLQKWLDGNYSNASVGKLLDLCEILNISPRHLQQNLDYFESYEEYLKSSEMLEKIKDTFELLKFSNKNKLYLSSQNLLHEQKIEQALENDNITDEELDLLADEVIKRYGIQALENLIKVVHSKRNSDDPSNSAS
ncbi:helix-turn-helix domain-containing protein [Enterococcus faecalis]|uniref:helix-turn-helix domain-containing protein n=1 Tax=Enterococcus faecalis TaxID=1351 RepID=UPI004043415D